MADKAAELTNPVTGHLAVDDFLDWTDDELRKLLRGEDEYAVLARSIKRRRERIGAPDNIVTRHGIDRLGVGEFVDIPITSVKLGSLRAICYKFASANSRVLSVRQVKMTNGHYGYSVERLA
jgi:hypothetical protein